MSRRPVLFLRVGLASALVSGGSWLACSDGPMGIIDPPPRESLVVSDPIAGTAVAGRVMARVVAGSGRSAEPSLVYVSLAPGTAPSGRYATLRVLGDALPTTTSVIDGGFDPVTLAAEVDDTIALDITSGFSDTVYTRLVPVARDRPPTIVRTNPPRKKTEVPINQRIVIVFSEPITPSSLTPQAVQLFRGTTPVAGAASLLQGTATAAVFSPDAPLDPNAAYRLVVTTVVTDLEGDALEADATVEFTTGTAVLGAVASVSVLPGNDSTVFVLVGSQFQVTAFPRDDQGNVLPGRPVAWSSAAPAIATVSATGLVTTLAEGQAQIVADVEGVIGVGHVSVQTGLTTLGSVIVTPESTRVTIGGSLVLGLELRDPSGRPIDAPRPFSWTSSSPAVATVTPASNRSAEVLGVGLGVALIVAEVEGKRDTAVVAVGPPGEIVALVPSPDSATLVLGATTSLSVAARDDQGFLNPVDSTQVAWASSDSSVASVSGSGLVTGLKAGSSSITGTWSGHQATVVVTVVALSFRAISAGGFHTCGVTPAGEAFCWGSGASGQLGVGRTPGWEGSLLPLAVVGGHAFTAVSVTWNSTCGLASDSTAYCWGLNWAAGTEQCSSGSPCNTTPTSVPGGLKFISLSAGHSGSACGVSVDSVAYCWGGTSAAPVAVAPGLKVTAITGGLGGHHCVLAMDGAAYCWGANSSGQLGTGDTNDYSPSPRPVAGGLTFSAIAAGGEHTCALTPTGSAYCWGKSPAWSTTGSLTPRAVMPGISFVTLSAGEFNTGGLDASGTAHFWNDRTSWTLPGAVPFATFDLGDYHHCAVTPAGVGYCAGRIGADAEQPWVKVGGQP